MTARAKSEPSPVTTFAGIASSTLDAPGRPRALLFGAPEATPYVAGRSSHAAEAPAAIRRAMAKYAPWHGHHDFDLGRTLGETLDGAVDAGDLALDPTRPESNRDAIRDATVGALAVGARPIVLGGDDSVQIPVLEAYREHGPIHVVQIDAHIDWREERFGERLGWSSTMRRASEMPWVAGIVQLGIRGVGSATPADLADARAWGARIVTAAEIAERGARAALDETLPAGARCHLALDCDGLDPATMPAVQALAPGGLGYRAMLDIVGAIGARGTLAGLSLVELVPARDSGGLGALVAGRIVCAALAAMRERD